MEQDQRPWLRVVLGVAVSFPRLTHVSRPFAFREERIDEAQQ